MALRIVVEGQGTIATALRWESTARLNASGRFSFSMPPSDPAAAWLVPLKRVFCYWDTTLVGGGIVEYVTLSNGSLQIEGGDLATELLHKAIRYANSTSAETIADQLGALLPAGWTYVNAITGTSNYVALNVMWDSLLNAINTLCELAGYWWHIVGSTLTIADGYGALVAGLTPLHLTRRTDASNVAGAVFPFGAGDGFGALELRSATLALLAPYHYFQLTMDIWTGYGIVRDDALGYPNPVRRRRLDFKNVAPQENSAAAIVTAANTLAVAAIEYLDKNATPIVEYTVEAVWPGVVRPLDRVSLVYNDESLKVSEVVVATEVSTRVTPEQLATVGMRLEASARRILSDDEIIADAIVASRMTPVYPQTSAFADFWTGIVTIDENTIGVLEARFPPQVLMVQSAVLRVAGGVVSKPSSLEGPTFGSGIVGVALVDAAAPTNYEVRINGAGAWMTVGTGVSVHALTVDAATDAPTAPSYGVELRGVAPAEIIAVVGTVPASVPALPAGTILKVLTITSCGWNSVTGAIREDTDGDGFIGGSNDTLLGYVRVGDVVEIATGVRLVSTYGSRTFWHYEVKCGGKVGWMPIYEIEGGVVTKGGRVAYSTAIYGAQVTVSIETRNVSQPF